MRNTRSGQAQKLFVYRYYSCGMGCYSHRTVVKYIENVYIFKYNENRIIAEYSFNIEYLLR